MQTSGAHFANHPEPHQQGTEVRSRAELPASTGEPTGILVRYAATSSEADTAAALLANQYWTQDFSLALMARAHLGSQAWVVACESDDRIVGSARAVSDGARFAWLMDVIVAPEQRGRGIGQALVRALLEHPALRGVAYIGLRTRDAHGLYTKFGFISEPGSAVQMGLKRAQP
jgi:ribosomal protein S18 acetylase RimI-like enzyme